MSFVKQKGIWKSGKQDILENLIWITVIPICIFTTYIFKGIELGALTAGILSLHRTFSKENVLTFGLSRRHMFHWKRLQNTFTLIHDRWVVRVPQKNKIIATSESINSALFVKYKTPLKLIPKYPTTFLVGGC